MNIILFKGLRKEFMSNLKEVDDSDIILPNDLKGLKTSLEGMILGSDRTIIVPHNNADYDAAIEKAQSSPDEEEQIQAYKEAQKILSDTAANVYLQDLADFVALNPEFTGYEFYPIYAVDFSKIKPAA